MTSLTVTVSTDVMYFEGYCCCCIYIPDAFPGLKRFLSEMSVALLSSYPPQATDRQLTLLGIVKGLTKKKTVEVGMGEEEKWG
jgi:hypothetical protein